MEITKVLLNQNKKTIVFAEYVMKSLKIEVLLNVDMYSAGFALLKRWK